MLYLNDKSKKADQEITMSYLNDKLKNTGKWITMSYLSDKSKNKEKYRIKQQKISTHTVKYYF